MQPSNVVVVVLGYSVRSWTIFLGPETLDVGVDGKYSFVPRGF